MPVEANKGRAIIVEIGEIIDWFFGLSNLQQGIISLILTVIIAFIVKRLVWLPLDRFADQTESEVDDEVIDSIGSMTFTAVIIVGMVVSLNFALKDNDVISIGNNILLIFLVLFFARQFSKLTSLLAPIFFSQASKKIGVDLEGAQSTSTILLKVIIWATCIFLCLEIFGVDITALLASMTIISLVIGMALQDSATKMITSAQLLIDQPFKVGDKIEVLGYTGIVKGIGMMSTKMQTHNGLMVILPNQNIATSTIINYAKGGTDDAPRRVNLRVEIGVGYSENPSHVKQVMKRISSECPFISKSISDVNVAITLLDGSSVNYRISMWIDDYEDEWITRDWLFHRILTTFEEENIEIPFPHLSVITEKNSALSVASKKKKDARIHAARLKEATEVKDYFLHREEMRQRQNEINSMLNSNDDEQDSLSKEEIELLRNELLEIDNYLAHGDDN
ncbi:MAG: hypothetical protein CXT69_05105 [Methanobacteriota archaeon]|jgi:small-conductance mechanosensitive channel|nr:MAG: hypothetical protein CXT69_05105 [Euryarchaeota archaeon]HIK78867.1 mechanosensitive ion channel family protein [Candidatus Poseidoniales archaeon]